jgi:hypothetical protein
MAAARAQHSIDEDDDYETILIYRSCPNPIEMAGGEDLRGDGMGEHIITITFWRMFYKVIHIGKGGYGKAIYYLYHYYRAIFFCPLFFCIWCFFLQGRLVEDFLSPILFLTTAVSFFS